MGFTIDPAAVADVELLLECTLSVLRAGSQRSSARRRYELGARGPLGLKRTGASGTPQPWVAVAVAVLAFFDRLILDAVVVNVALRSIQDSLGGGVQGLQWVVDGYTLMFAAFLLTRAGSLLDRARARSSDRSCLIAHLS